MVSPVRNNSGKGSAALSAKQNDEESLKTVVSVTLKGNVLKLVEAKKLQEVRNRGNVVEYLTFLRLIDEGFLSENGELTEKGDVLIKQFESAFDPKVFKS